MLAFKDFSPAIVKESMITGKVHADFHSCVEEANAWMRCSGIVPISVETLTLPNADQLSSRGSYYSSCDFPTCWLQVMRVWYDVPPLPHPSAPA
jgi:hypothetical protein